jgi:hypothetical protein
MERSAPVGNLRTSTPVRYPPLLFGPQYEIPKQPQYQPNKSSLNSIQTPFKVCPSKNFSINNKLQYAEQLPAIGNTVTQQNDIKFSYLKITVQFAFTRLPEWKL